MILGIVTIMPLISVILWNVRHIPVKSITEPPRGEKAIGETYRFSIQKFTPYFLSFCPKSGLKTNLDYLNEDKLLQELRKKV